MSKNDIPISAPAANAKIRLMSIPVLRKVKMPPTIVEKNVIITKTKPYGTFKRESALESQNIERSLTLFGLQQVKKSQKLEENQGRESFRHKLTDQ